MDNLVAWYDMSEINPQNICPSTVGSYNGTGTGIAAANIVDGMPGSKATQYNGTDEKTDFGDIGNIRTIIMAVKPDTTTEEICFLDTGKDIMVSAGTVTYTGLTATATYVNGVASTALAAGSWQILACVLNAAVDANNFELATDGTNFGAVSLDSLFVFSTALTETQIKDITWKIRTGRMTSWRINSPKYLKGYYPLNGHALDLVGGNNGTWSTEGYRDSAFGKQMGDFDGANSLVTTTYTDAIFTNGGSISLLVDADSDGENNFGFPCMKESEFIIYVQSEASGAMELGFYHYFSGDDGLWSTTSTELNVGVPSVLTVTYDNSAVGNDPIFYLNGELLALTEGQAPTITAITNTNALLLGNNPSQARTFDGGLGSYYIHSCEITWDEHLQLARMIRRGA